MKYILQKPNISSRTGVYPLWVVLHGAYDVAEQAITLFGPEAAARNAFLLAPQASRPCGDGYCWSFARDAADIQQLLADVRIQEPIDPERIMLIGFSMGCTMGGWVLAQHPKTFRLFAALSMGSAFEPWELDDGGIDLVGLQQASTTTKVLLAVDQADPYRSNEYFAANLAQFRQVGFQVETCRPNHGVHDATDDMKVFVLNAVDTMMKPIDPKGD